jgi:signal transduction histidine kinase
VFGLTRLHELDAGIEIVSQGYHRLTRFGAQLEASYRNSEQATGRLLDEPDTAARMALLMHAVDYQPRVAREKVQSARALIEKLRRMPAGAEEAPFLDRVDGLFAALTARYAEYAAEGLEVRRVIDELARFETANGGRPDAALDAAVRRLKLVEQGIGLGIRDLQTELDTRIDQRVRRIGEDERRSALLVLVFSLVAAIVGLFVTFLSQRALAPIRQLTAAVKDAGEGRFSQIPEGPDDELGLLARELNAMAKKLVERDRQLADKTQELLRSERLAAVGRLAAQITHEIRNPLASLSLNAELLQEQLDAGALDAQEARDLVHAMAREVDRLAEVTEEYLRFARMPKPTLERVDLNDAVDELATFMGPELAGAGVDVRRELAEASPAVRADPGQLRQVLLNLVRNAREAAGRGGHVRLVTRVRDGAMADVEVQDDGPGMADDVKQRIFEPFFTTKELGTGLGLALVQQIVHEHAGELRCDSAPGRGTRMVVSLPIARPEVRA